MKKKNVIKRMIALILMLFFMTSVLSACGSTGKKDKLDTGEAKIDSETGTEANPETVTGTETEANSESKTEAETETETETQNEEEAEMVTQANPNANAPAFDSMHNLVKAMQPGWNLAGSLEAGSGENSWGSPYTTKEIVDKVAEAGFKSFRLPITWNVAVDESGGNKNPRVGSAPDYKLNEAFLAHVKEIVDWAIDADMIVIINTHHDWSGSWFYKTISDGADFPQDQKDNFAAIWRQVAEYFKDYSNGQLIFEGMNEPRFDNDWWLNNKNYKTALDTMQTLFYETVRGTGGNNATRPLVITSYCGSVWLTGGDQPDTVEHTYNKLVEMEKQYSETSNVLVTVHDYGPDEFGFARNGKAEFNEKIRNDTKYRIDWYDKNLVQKGIPVYIGECGLLAFDNSTYLIQHGEWMKFWEFYTSYLNSKGITYMYWDNDNDRGQLRRDAKGSDGKGKNPEWNYQDFVDVTMASAQGFRSSRPDFDTIYIKSGEEISDKNVLINLYGNTLTGVFTQSGEELVSGYNYLMEGDTLTLLAGTIGSLMKPEYGLSEKLTLKFSEGADANVDLILHAAPVLDATSSGSIRNFTINTDYCGNAIKSIEANGQFFSLSDTLTYSTTKTILRSLSDINDKATTEVTIHYWSGESVVYSFTRSGDIVTGELTNGASAVAEPVIGSYTELSDSVE